MFFEEEEKQRRIYFAKQKIVREWIEKGPYKKSIDKSKRAKKKRVAQTVYMEELGVDAIAVYDVEYADVLIDEYEDTV